MMIIWYSIRLGASEKNCLLKPAQQSGKKHTGKCVEGKRKSMVTS
jgi:hypothetical protein